MKTKTTLSKQNNAMPAGNLVSKIEDILETFESALDQAILKLTGEKSKQELRAVRIPVTKFLRRK